MTENAEPFIRSTNEVITKRTRYILTVIEELVFNSWFGHKPEIGQVFVFDELMFDQISDKDTINICHIKFPRNAFNIEKRLVVTTVVTTLEEFSEE